MALFSYVVRWDIGFAPNPFFGVCSLATCKPDIRRSAQPGDWIVGTGSQTTRAAGGLVFAMKVDEVLDFDQYWNDPRFLAKRPKLHGSRMQQFGDNIYHHAPDGSWMQENSRHSKTDGSPEPRHIDADTRTERVLLGRNFVYFGGDGPAVPRSLRYDYGFDLVTPGRGYRRRFTDEHEAAAQAWFSSLGHGVLGRPLEWKRATRASRAA